MRLRASIRTQYGPIQLIVVGRDRITLSIEESAPILIRGSRIDGTIYMIATPGGWTLNNQSGMGSYFSLKRNRQRVGVGVNLTKTQEDLITQMAVVLVNEWVQKHPAEYIAGVRFVVMEEMQMRLEEADDLHAKLSAKQEQIRALAAQLEELQ